MVGESEDLEIALGRGGFGFVESSGDVVRERGFAEETVG